MTFLQKLKIENTKINTKGSEYYESTYDSNLDLFAKISRFNDSEEIIKLFNDALNEDKEIALANLLYILDIRNGKGERRIFKIIFKDLCINNSECALRILPFIGMLGRYDYILEGINTPIENDVLSLIKYQLESDINSNNPSLLAKWLPSHRTHNVNSKIAKKIMKFLTISEREYRKMLSSLREKINIVEKNLTNGTYENIEFSKVPTKAMLKYNQAFQRHMALEYAKYKEDVKSGKQKVNTEGLFSYEIVKKIMANSGDDELYDLMWKNQKDVLNNCETNVLVMADTSGSMTCCDCLPYASAIGLAIYTAERNSGIFKNHFITFSSKPSLWEVKGNTIKEKIKNIKSIVDNTNIDSAFQLLLDTACKHKINEAEMPSHILIISDMEFDRGVYSETGTNFDGWKKAFSKRGYKLPKIIFWNVAGYSRGVPVTKFENDVAMVSGFSVNILENLLTLENCTPSNIMLEKLAVYLEMLKIND